MAEISPMMKQYKLIKEKNKDSILFFRLGDFYEMFFEDAEIASKELELVLTGRDCGQDERAPMCGVPYHSCEAYIARLVAKGYKVAICEQTELPSQAKGIVNREVVRIITPGTIVEGSMLDETKNNYLCVIFKGESGYGVCFVDVSTGELNLTEIQEADALTDLISTIARFMPSEVLINKAAEGEIRFTGFAGQKLNCPVETLGEEFFESAELSKTILSHFKIQEISELQIGHGSGVFFALGAALKYLIKTQKTVLNNINRVNLFSANQYMKIDLSTRRNLELCETIKSKEKRGSLLFIIDKTKTAMGKRLIRNWLEQPLLNTAEIIKRQNAVDELVQNTILRRNVSESLCGIYDLERIIARVSFGNANARELKTLSLTFAKIPALKAELESVKSAYLTEIYNNTDELADLRELIDGAIVDDPPLSVREGGIIKRGYCEELDSFVSDMTGGKDVIAAIEAKEKEETGIKNLKVGYNRVFGYYIEVTNSYKQLIPAHYIRKQTLSNCERFITEELKELEKRVLGAQEKTVALEYELFEKIRKTVANEHLRVQKTAKMIAALDVLISLAAVADENHYTRPEIATNGGLSIKEGRHPVVETMLKNTPFVPNDTELDLEGNRCAVITGPNMAGKSTYMRQVALIVLLSQIGSFVPASFAKISLVDAIFTRVGASDDLGTGQSTFMVEMNEVAFILKNATKNSLLIFDEIGRGTSTFDGMSIARAVIEHVADKRRLGAKAMFSTHYHELTELENILEGVKNYNIAAKKRGDEIIFLRRIVRGGCDDSYGIEVANLAGVPQSVVKRSKEVLAELEAGREITPARPPAYKKENLHEDYQIGFESNAQNELINQLKTLDVNTLTPIEAMTKLYGIVKQAKEI